MPENVAVSLKLRLPDKISGSCRKDRGAQRSMEPVAQHHDFQPQLCQFETVSSEGFTPFDCAQFCAQWRFGYVLVHLHRRSEKPA